MANKIKQKGIGNQAFQDIHDSEINVTNIYGRSPEYIDMLDQLKQLEDHLKLIPDTDPEQRSNISAKIFKLRERLESFKSDVLKLAESFSRIEINTDRLRRAKEHFDKGEITEARVVLENALEEMADEKRGLLAKKKEFEEDTIPKLQSKADEYLILAQTTALNYESPTRVADAGRYFEDSIECIAFSENLFAYAEFLYDHSAFRRALDLWQRVLRLARKDNNEQNESACLGNLGLAYYSLGEYRKAIEFHGQRLKIACELGDRLGEGQSLGNLGNAHYSLGKYQKAIEYQEQSLKIARELGNRLGEGQCLGNLGIAYGEQGKYQKAIEFQEQRLKITREIGDRLGEGQSLGNLGNAHYSLGKYQKAIEYQEQSLKIARELSDRLGEGQSLGNLGIAYRAQGEYQKAIEFQEQRLKIAREIGDRLGEGQSLGNLGIAHYSLGKYQKAIEFQEQRLKIARELGDRLGEGQSLANLGAAYNALGEEEKVCSYWRQSLTILEAIDVPEAEMLREWMEEAGCLEENSEDSSQKTE